MVAAFVKGDVDHARAVNARLLPSHRFQSSDAAPNPDPGQSHVADPGACRRVSAGCRSVRLPRGSRTPPARSFPSSVVEHPVRIVFLGRPGRDRPQLRLLRGRGPDHDPRLRADVPRHRDAGRRPGAARLQLPPGKCRPGRGLHRHPRSRGSLRRAELPAARAVIPDLRLGAHPGPGPEPDRGGRPARPDRARSRCATGSGARSARSMWSSSPSPTRCPTGSPPPSTPRRA